MPLSAPLVPSAGGSFPTLSLGTWREKGKASDYFLFSKRLVIQGLFSAHPNRFTLALCVA